MVSAYGATRLPPWEVDFNWQRRFIPELKRICGEHLIGEAPYEEDAERNTDLVVLKLDPVRVACRVRRYKYYQKYPDEFTIRSNRPNGNKTELAKIIEGWGDYILYGFCDEEEVQLISWVLGDLTVFRLWFTSYLAKHQGRTPGIEKPNHDNSSSFRVFSINDLPKSFVTARLTEETPMQMELSL